MRTNLKVPFAEKDDAKRLGARWDAAKKVWYIKDVDDLYPFAKWIPDLVNESLTVKSPPKKDVSVKTLQSTGTTIVGCNYVKVHRVCTCLPWEDCDRCKQWSIDRSV